MNTTTLSNKALAVIDQYLHFTFGSAVCSVPYFNNKTVRARAALRATIGKGSPEDIKDEIQTFVSKNHLEVETLTSESLKKLLVDNNIGIECSGFAYHVLNAESQERGKGTLTKHLRFVNCGGFIGKIRAKLRPIENCNVATFADDTNSHIVPINDVRPGDIITMVNDTKESERNHILVIHQVEYKNSKPIRISYSHAVAYPEDGLYGTGVNQGTIEITDIDTSITNGLWLENGSAKSTERIFDRAKIAKTELRRLKWF